MSLDAFGDLLQAGSPLAILAAAAFGLLTSLGPCTFLRGATLFALVGQRPERRQGLLVAIAFVAGLTVIYSLLGLVAGLLTDFADVSAIVFPIAGVALVALGFNSADLIRVRLPKGPDSLYRLRTKLAGGAGYANSFALGGSFGFMVCPCCLPALLLIFSFTFAQGAYVPGFVLIAAFTIAHSVPLLLMGYFAQATKRFAAYRRYESYINLGLSVILVVTGVIVLWIS